MLPVSANVTGKDGNVTLTRSPIGLKPARRLPPATGVAWIARAARERRQAARRISALTARVEAILGGAEPVPEVNQTSTDGVTADSSGADGEDSDMISTGQAARLLRIEPGTLALWGRLGVMRSVFSPEGELFRREELLTFLAPPPRQPMLAAPAAEC
jgi:hypothetical protein